MAPPSAASVDDSLSPRNDRKRKAEDAALLPKELLMARDARGECPTCGMRVREKGDGPNMVPMTRPNRVDDGRCLHCHPDRPMDEETLVPSEISVTGAAAQAAAAGAGEEGINDDDDGSPSVIRLKAVGGSEYVGLVTEGTVEKGRGVFSHYVHKDGEFKGKARMYEGEFEDGFFEGRGTWRGANGTVYEGEFKKGTGHGHGKVTWSNGARYEGEFKDGLFHGKGKYFWANGDVFEGNWTNGKRHGQGEMRYASGSIKKGNWRENKFVG